MILFFGPSSRCDLSFWYLKRAGYDTQVGQQVNGGQRNTSRICAPIVVVVVLSKREPNLGIDGPTVGSTGLNSKSDDVARRGWYEVLTCTYQVRTHVSRINTGGK